ncbi:radical SAM protein (plasmid) [Rhodococcus qingshengii]|jgi:uncharacterized protein|uniref:radical SAM/SPASM domain-containing protein n=1 Tax=Rhodococcus qingshengii TaxID=334542 RepID=UPI0011EC2621|nr:radical SAM protein [Rhodococcus qingshengii]QEM25544.1 radical SAM protein [Rhodococcus qingshengii]
MRLSYYTRITDLGDDTSLLLNLPRKRADVLPNEVVALIEAGSLDEQADTSRAPLEAGYLTSLSAEDEVTWFQQLVAAQVSDTQAANIAVVTTNSCNLACSYCFQADTGMRALPQRYLTEAHADSILRSVTSLIGSRGVSHLELFGGEPLLPRLGEVVRKLVRGGAALGLQTHATTNGVFLHQFADLLSPAMLNDLIVSVDGTAEYHDLRRVPMSGAPTFSTIIDNIELALDKGVSVAIRPNIDRRNIDGLPKLIDFLGERGILAHELVAFHHVNVHPDPLSPERGVGDHYMSAIEIDEYLIERGYGDFVSGEHSAMFGSLGSTSSRLTAYLRDVISRPMYDACGAPARNIYFSPEGAIYNCHELVGRPDKAVGMSTKRGIVELPLWDKWRARRVDLLKNCQTCNLALAHGGGCGARLDPDSLDVWGVCAGFPEEFDTKVVALAREDRLAIQSA